MAHDAQDDLGKNSAALRDARLRALLSRSEVCQRAGVSRQQISRIEQGLNGEIAAHAIPNPKGPKTVIHLAVFQFVIGFFLIAALIHLTRRIAAKIFATELTCDAISPDSALTCRREPGHSGWCRNETHSWHGDVWNMDHWADTLSWWTADVERNGDPTERAPAPPTPAAKEPRPSKASWKTYPSKASWRTDPTKPEVGGILERCERPEYCYKICTGKCPLKMTEWYKPTDFPPAVPERLTLQDLQDFINNEAAAETGAGTGPK